MKKGSIRHPVIDGLQWCFVCESYKDLDKFHADNSNPRGIDSVCKRCKGAYQKVYQAQYYQEHKDDLLPKHRITAKASIQRRKEVMP